MEIRTLTDADRPALERLLLPTEARSLFLLGNARESGIDDRGGARNGCWMGAFVHGELQGVAAWFRGFGSLIPACGPHAAAILPALLERVGKPKLVLGPVDRVEAALAHIPWPVKTRMEDTLLVVRWEDFAPRPLDLVHPALPAEADEVGEAIGAMHREVGAPTDPQTNAANARRLIAEGRVQSIREDGRLVAISMEGAATGSYVQVGATWCAAHRRRSGYAGACVTAVLERARAEGRASEGGVLFTGADNLPALGLYGRLGFRPEAAWVMAFL